MQIREALKEASKKLHKSSTPNLDARLLLGVAMGVTYEQLLLSYDKELSVDSEEEFFKLIARRESMEPIAYIISRQEFYGLDFIVNKNVLIPRPDTELLVDIMINDCNQRSDDETITILELGVGSGAISITLAAQIITSEITALDISSAALKVAKTNAEIHNVLEQVNFIKSDWYSSLGAEKYDYIVSNPPYISQGEKEQMAEETYIFEPDIALYASDNGLAAYKIIIASAHKYLKPCGKLVLEIGYLQKEAITNILREHAFTELNVKQDLAGRDRVIIARQCV